MQQTAAIDDLTAIDDQAAIDDLAGRRARGPHHGKRAGNALRTVIAALLLTVLPAVLLTACGSSSKPLTSAQVKQQTCKRVEAALSDGPDPEADPVGHAQAQILPLHEIHTSDTKLASAISDLASAYQQFTASDGASSATTAVNSATSTIKALCPGIEP